MRRISELAGPPPARLLELGVGTGRVALPLVEAGYAVTGVEASPAMAQVLREKPGGERVTLVEDDFGQTSFAGPFDVVYGADFPLTQMYPRARLRRCLRAVGDALAPDGCFVVDAAVAPRERLGQARIRNETRLSGGGRLVTDFHHDTGGGVGWGTATVIASNGREYSASVLCSYLWPAQLDRVAAEAGLALEWRAGTWDGAPHDDDDLVFVSCYRAASTPRQV